MKAQLKSATELHQIIDQALDALVDGGNTSSAFATASLVGKKIALLRTEIAVCKLVGVKPNSDLFLSAGGAKTN